MATLQKVRGGLWFISEDIDSTIPWAKLDETMRNITANKTFEVVENILTTELLSNSNKTMFIYRKTSSNFRIFVPAFNSSSPELPKNLYIKKPHCKTYLKNVCFVYFIQVKSF